MRYNSRILTEVDSFPNRVQLEHLENNDFSDRPVLVEAESGRVVTAGELGEVVRSIAGWLWEEKEQRVVVPCDRRALSVALSLAAVETGAEVLLVDRSGWAWERAVAWLEKGQAGGAGDAVRQESRGRTESPTAVRAWLDAFPGGSESWERSEGDEDEWGALHKTSLGAVVFRKWGGAQANEERADGRRAIATAGEGSRGR